MAGKSLQDSLSLISVDQWGAIARLAATEDGRHEIAAIFDGGRFPFLEAYRRFLNIFAEADFQVRSLRDYRAGAPDSRCVVLYHDVHCWDVLCALGLMIENHRRGLSSTFFVNWDFAPEDVVYRDAFRTLIHMGDGVHDEIGLHAAPVPSWLRMEAFGGDDEAFLAWVNSSQAEEDLKVIVTGNGLTSFGVVSLQEVHEASQCRLAAQVEAVRAEYPSLAHMNAHGDDAGRLLNRLFNKTEDVRFRDLHCGFFVTEEMCAACGLQDTVMTYQRRNAALIRHIWEPQIAADMPRLLPPLLAEGEPRFVLNHPLGFADGRLKV